MKKAPKFPQKNTQNMGFFSALFWNTNVPTVNSEIIAMFLLIHIARGHKFHFDFTMELFVTILTESTII